MVAMMSLWSNRPTLESAYMVRKAWVQFRRVTTPFLNLGCFGDYCSCMVAGTIWGSVRWRFTFSIKASSLLYHDFCSHSIMPTQATLSSMITIWPFIMLSSQPYHCSYVPWCSKMWIMLSKGPTASEMKIILKYVRSNQPICQVALLLTLAFESYSQRYIMWVKRMKYSTWINPFYGYFNRLGWEYVFTLWSLKLSIPFLWGKLV